jgi:hypothetical protein
VDVDAAVVVEIEVDGGHEVAGGRLPTPST